MNLTEKYMNEGSGVYQKGKTDIKGLFAAAKGFTEAAEKQFNNDYFKGALQTLENLQKNVLKDLIKGIKTSQGK